jgi:hypothetical protein
MNRLQYCFEDDDAGGESGTAPEQSPIKGIDYLYHPEAREAGGPFKYDAYGTDGDANGIVGEGADIRTYFTQDANYDVTGAISYDSGTSTWGMAEHVVYDPYGTANFTDENWTAARTR